MATRRDIQNLETKSNNNKGNNEAIIIVNMIIEPIIIHNIIENDPHKNSTKSTIF